MFVKFVGYVFFVLIGFIIWLIVKCFLCMWLLKIFVFIVFVLGVFGLVFLFNFIYEGDFFNDVCVEMVFGELKVVFLYLFVIIIFGCLFCMESIFCMKVLKEKYFEIVIIYFVCSKDVEVLKFYREVVGILFFIVLVKDLEVMVKLVGGIFFIFVLNCFGEL